MYGCRNVLFFFYSASSGDVMSFSNTLVLFVLISSDFYNKPPSHAAVEKTESWAKKQNNPKHEVCAEKQKEEEKEKARNITSSL